MKKANSGGRNAPLRVEEMLPKKLALWNSRTFTPIITHDELEPILVSAGFMRVSPSNPPPRPPTHQGGEKAPPEEASATSKTKTDAMGWREYAYSRSTSSAVEGGAVWLAKAPLLPRPRMPYPRIDGLHLMTYKAFLGSLEFILGPDVVPNLFHVRAMPLTQALDLVFDKAYRPMRDCGMDDEGLLLYRDGTVDDITKTTCSLWSNDSNDSRNINFNNAITTSCIKRASCDNKNENPANSTYLVYLKDLFPSRNIARPI